MATLFTNYQDKSIKFEFRPDDEILILSKVIDLNTKYGKEGNFVLDKHQLRKLMIFLELLKEDQRI